jgi:hypothetical protein
MRTSLVAVVLSVTVTLIAGCSSKAKGTADPGTGASGSVASGSASGSAVASGSAAPASGPSYGQPCGAGDACAAGLKCVKYYGVAGASGPELSSCEKTCGADADCPSGMACKTVADGPGHVCR